MKTENIIKDKAFDFALDSIKPYKSLNEEKEYVFVKQFIRSATSIGANINEAQAGISKRDFIAKMSIASKEARESNYWLQLLKQAKIINYNYEEVLLKSEEILKILTSIIKTSQANLKSIY